VASRFQRLRCLFTLVDDDDGAAGVCGAELTDGTEQHPDELAMAAAMRAPIKPQYPRG
jgi:hypothetical protein